MRRSVLAAVGLAGFLTVCDQLFHVRTATLVYHWDPQLAGQTVLVPFTFLAACLAMLAVSRRVATDAGSWAAVAVSLGLVTAAYLVSGLVDPGLAGAYAVLLLALWIARSARRREGRAAVMAALVIAVGGVLGEAVLMSVGEFSYLHPDGVGVPWWLFPLYLHGAVAAFDVSALLRTSPGAPAPRTDRGVPSVASSRPARP